jgi:hypothetical protein
MTYTVKINGKFRITQTPYFWTVEEEQARLINGDEMIKWIPRGYFSSEKSANRFVDRENCLRDPDEAA